MPEIIYEDNHLLVAVKPQNQLTQSDRTGDISLHDELKAYIGAKYHKPGAVYLGLVHRMDRPVGGLVAFARTSKAASRLSEQLRARRMEREYLAVAEGDELPDRGRLCDALLQDGDTGSVRCVPEGTPGAQAAALSYEVLARQSGLSLVHVKLDTGRKHQIRAQLSHAGYPILYDMRYGYGQRGRSIALWGAVLRLEHPTLRKPMTFVSSPENGAFAPFASFIKSFLDTASKE